MIKCERTNWEMRVFYAWKSMILIVKSRKKDIDIGGLITFK